MYDLLIKGGTVFDGRGSDGVVADVAIQDGKIVAVGRASEAARETIDATGRYVTPGFIDGHTHLDALIFWDPYCGSLLDHGVTSAVMGNCGFTLAPGDQSVADLIVRSIERAEDMSRDAINRGVPWTWSSFPDYMQAVDDLPKALNIGTQVGHCALRAVAMGERAFTDEATDREIERMSEALRAALAAGAMGFSTSRSTAHVTKSGGPVPSRQASWDEVRRLVLTMREFDVGVFQLAPERSSEPTELADFQNRLSSLAVESKRTVTFMVGGQREQLGTIDSIIQAGGSAYGQVHVRGFENVFGFRTTLPFDRLPLWSSVRSGSMHEQRASFSDRELVARLVAEAQTGDYGEAKGAEVRAPDYDHLMVINGSDPERSVAELATERGTDPVAIMIDLALTSDFEQLFRQPISETSDELVLTALRHPKTVIAASDSGAHISQLLDSNIPTYFLSRWVRGERAFDWPEAIHMLTGIPAEVWGLTGRGVIEAGAHADVLVFDPETIGCAKPVVRHDLPDGGPRLIQPAVGIDAVLVAGRAVMRSGQRTGELPGRLFRGGRTEKAIPD